MRNEVHSTNWLGFIGNVLSQRGASSAKPSPQPAKRNHFLMEGKLEKGKTTPYAINGEDFIMDENSWLFGDLVMGSHALVKGCYRSGIVPHAIKVIVK